jgi:hypothetical protein
VQQPNRLSGEVDWQTRVINIPPGTNALAWRYSKDPDTSAGLDAAWLDEVKFAAGIWLEISATPTNGQTQLILHAVPGKLYEVQISTNFVNWSRLNLVTPTSPTMLLNDTNAASGTRFYRLHDLQSSIWFEQPAMTNGAFQIVLHSSPALQFQIQTSSNLSSWGALTNVTNVSGMMKFSDPSPMLNNRRFYRAKLGL